MPGTEKAHNKKQKNAKKKQQQQQVSHEIPLKRKKDPAALTQANLPSKESATQDTPSPAPSVPSKTWLRKQKYGLGAHTHVRGQLKGPTHHTHEPAYVLEQRQQQEYLHRQQQDYHLQQLREHSAAMPFVVTAKGIPTSWGTLQVYKRLEVYGTIKRIECSDHRDVVMTVKVFFDQMPKETAWLNKPIDVRRKHDNRAYTIRFTVDRARRPYLERLREGGKEFPQRMTVPLSGADFGIMRDPHTMVTGHSIETSQTSFMLDLQQKQVEVIFRLFTGDGWDGAQLYKLRIDLSELKLIRVVGVDSKICFVITLESPPMMFRKTTDVTNTHDRGSTLWDERQMWFRQTDVDLNPTNRSYPIGLQKQNAIIDIGRWLTYRFVFDVDKGDMTFRNIIDALKDSGVTFVDNHHMNFETQTKITEMWKWLSSHRGNSHTGLSDLHELNDENVNLSFPVRYALESCISHNLIHESNITSEFLRSLDRLDSSTAVTILEKIVDEKKRYFEPQMALRTSITRCEKQRPAHCSKILAVTVTPTTIYLNTPVLETSNRVIRKYQEYENHFLRVKFTEERYRGRLMSYDGRAMDEVYSRIKQAMTHGIQIGDRRYDFLAFGNSQFREHGAYFFARTGNGANALTADKIRRWMGEFSHINVVAKYASRLGQCFSTTRAVSTRPEIKQIADIVRNNYTFTDGVGKISPLFAQVIRHYHELSEVPSVVQFRLGGCKGVLTIDPTLRGREIHLRPSQQKFPSEFAGLEVCRVSRFSSAHLNVQIILVLSSRGVLDATFLTKESVMLKDLDEAMINVPKARKLLRQNVDFNQTSLQLASMVDDGFMAAQEPFFMSCLTLWRAWNLKYLKQKAKIFIEKGALLLGTVDETGTLRGHFNSDPIIDLRDYSNNHFSDSEQERDDRINSTLPQIFVQVTDHVNRRMKVVTGRCILLRNPSLHPGDARVVLAIDVPALHHIKNAVVLPQTGDRDLGNMSSGGDLDGDDYVVIWDQDLIPPEINYPAMDYTAPDPQISSGQVTVDDLTSFFVTHIKNDNLGPIAVAHRYLADAAPQGVKLKSCLRLAQLHSEAVDYAKTGVPAEFPKDLRPTRWPHWSEQKHKAAHKIYHSKGIVGQLYDAVTLDSFSAAPCSLPFDQRILGFASDNVVVALLPAAVETKAIYDEALRRLMFQYGIKSEFEVWTSFVLEHSSDHGGDWKFAESLGESFMALNHHYQDICFERAGTSRDGRDWALLKPWVIAMYKVTADESQRRDNTGDQQVPLISFPWLFPHELGVIATEEHILADSFSRDSSDDKAETPTADYLSSRENSDDKGGLLADPLIQKLHVDQAETTTADDSSSRETPDDIGETSSRNGNDSSLTSASLRHDLHPSSEVASPAPPEDATYDQFYSEQDLMDFSDEESMAGDENRPGSSGLILTPATSNLNLPEGIRTPLESSVEVLNSAFLDISFHDPTEAACRDELLAREAEILRFLDDDARSLSHGRFTPASSAPDDDLTERETLVKSFTMDQDNAGEDAQESSEQGLTSSRPSLLDQLSDLLTD
jgi:RNA-dependent RNA polymerase